MMNHADAITERLPALYRDGDLLGQLADVAGLQLEIIDEQARIIQRAHWFDTTVELNEAAALGALLDMRPEPWQELGEYRAWVHALRTARLVFGAVTGPALRAFVELYAEAFESTNGIDAVAPFESWGSVHSRIGHALIENPLIRRTLRLGGPGAVEPLQQQRAHNNGLEAAPISALLTGGPDSEYVPVLVNLTTGEALIFHGELKPGDRLWVRPDEDGSVSAQLNRVDVTSHLRSVHQVSPGRPWTEPDMTGRPRALSLTPGHNDLWFLPVAHYDEPGLDRALLALAELTLTQGRWDASSFDEALFHQDPAAYLDLAWDERLPATVLIDLDAGTLRSPAGQLDEAHEAVDQLTASVGAGIASLAAAGVATEVRFRPLYDSQRQLDHLVFISGMAVHEMGTVGSDRLSDAGGLFDITAFHDSTYQ